MVEGKVNLRAAFDPAKRFSIHYLGGLYRRINEHHLFLLSGGLAFSLFVCIIPMVLIIFSILGSLLQSADLQSRINLLIDAAIPFPPYAFFVKGLIAGRVDEFKQYRAVAGFIGSFGLLLAASGLFSSIRTVLNRVYNVPDRRNFAIGKLRDLGMILLVLCLLIAFVTLLPVIEALRNSALSVETLQQFNLDGVRTFFFAIVTIAGAFAVFSLIYALVPYGKLGARVILVSALWSTLLWEMARQLFGVYLSHGANLKNVYGAYTFVVVVAFWIYYSAVVFIIGAEIGQLYREWKTMRAVESVSK